MRIALQVIGELRNFNTIRRLHTRYREILGMRGVDLDIFLATSESIKARRYESLGYFDDYTGYSIETLPGTGIVPNKLGKFEENTTGRSSNLYNWSYFLYRTYHQRRVFQLRNGVNYDYVIACRVDSVAPYNFWNDTINAVERFHTDRSPNYSDFSIYTYRGLKATDSRFIENHLNFDDIKIAGDEYAMNIFCSSMHLMYMNQDPSFIGTYHNLPGLVIQKYNLNLRTDGGECAKWAILRKDDGIRVRNDLDIDKRYFYEKA